MQIRHAVFFTLILAFAATAYHAANGNQNGAFVDAGSTPPAPTPREYVIADRGGTSGRTDGVGAQTVGYARIQPDSGNTTPAGVAIFSLRQNNVLVTEGGVPAAPSITSGRIFAEVNGPVNTGLAIANPNSVAATITFNFTNSAGADYGSSSITLAANQKLARFLNESPFNSGSGLQGTFTFTSNVPVSVIALRGFTNERGEFLITTLPVTDLSASTSAETAILSHFASGGGWTSEIVLVNPTAATIEGTIQFFSPGTNLIAAVALTLVASAQGGPPLSADTFTYRIPGRTSFKLVTISAPSGFASGSVRVRATTGVTPSSLVVFSYKPGAITVAEAGIPAIRGSRFRMYVEATGITNAPGTIQTGLAIANLSQTSRTVTLELFNLNGTSTGLVTTQQLPGNGQLAKFAHELFPLAFPFQGILRITGGEFSVVGLRGRYNERGDFLITTTPPSNEETPGPATELLFPHIANGGGYTMQFVLFSGASGQNANGNLRFFREDGTTLNLTLQ